MSKITPPRFDNPLFVAIDTTDAGRAAALARAVASSVGGIKLGLEFFMANGAGGVQAVRSAAPDLPLFLDLKFHDIPNTVAGAVRAVAPLAPALLTIHASGGPAMIRAAREAAAEAADRLGIATPPAVVAVTVLTSLDDTDLMSVGQRGPSGDQVLRLTDTALAHGAAGVVCAPTELSRLRGRFGSQPLMVVPGIRPADAARGDQKRVMTPAEARSAGADVLVVGRPITGAEDPAEAAARIAGEIAAAELTGAA